MQLEGHFLNDGIRGMLEQKNYCAAELVILIIGVYNNHA